MLVFPNCKINLGLNVTAKRPDGYHDLETVFYPVNWRDALEVIASAETKHPFHLSQSGIAIEGRPENNLLYKTWELISAQKKLPALNVHLHKHIPMGAGLGGGSADAAYFINLLSTQFNLGYTAAEKMDLAAQLGSDCAFFINNTPVMATGRGNVFSHIQVNLSNYYILLVYPGIHSNTKDAYSGLTPKPAQYNLKEVIETQPLNRWKDLLTNDFEESVFKKHPAVAALKKNMYAAGAIYACMSGSGSAVFGIFDTAPELNFPATHSHYLQKPLAHIL